MKIREKNGRVHTYDTDVTNQSFELKLPHYNNFMVTVPKVKIFKNS